MPKKSYTKLTLSERFTTFIGTPKSVVIHTILFASIFSLRLLDVSLDHILLILTTFLSIEAIYLAIFIQMSINRNTESLEEVEEDIDEIQEDVEEDDQHDKQLEKSLSSIQNQLVQLQKDIANIQKKGL